METIDAHKFSSELNTINKVNTKTALPAFTNEFATARSKFSDYSEEKPFDHTKISKIEKDDNKSKNKILFYSLDYNTNLNLLNQRLLEKIKIIKNLEKEIRDKNNLIEKLYQIFAMYYSIRIFNNRIFG